MQLEIVVPCFNEELVLEGSVTRLISVLVELESAGEIASGKIILVDDGSQDDTWNIIETLAASHAAVHGIKLSRNVGHQNALLAGLMSASGDAIVSIDADLQDDVAAIKDMVREFQTGAEVVYGVRRARKTDTVFKRKTAEWFYRLLGAIGVKIIYNHADFRLLSRRAIESLKQFREVNLFMRGIIPLLGFESRTVLYDRGKRFAGESKYPLRKMATLALDGITSFSVVPLRLITLLGFVVFIGTTLMSLWVLGIWIFTDRAVPGWASTVLPMYFLGGIQILSIGVIGEYLGKVYSEVKSRPRYIIEKTI